MTTWQVFPLLVSRHPKPFEGFTGRELQYLNQFGADGWEPIGMTLLATGNIMLLYKRQSEQTPQPPPPPPSIGFVPNE